ncbi:helix-turn-helix domain-containing protein [Pleurocapsa sp. PCC 7319]|uniref:helix-turn-helix domain-containing protein n=1 Tax=Pleurocapsa sp. PCC 7319 TaxID=118161 RepID=UPI00037F0A97|nr:helix-turn-helix transcriptional regulator [Pleurocapsa sp. PCC 7319]
MEHSEAKISNKRSKCKKNNPHESNIENKSDLQNTKQIRSPTEAPLCQNNFYEECPSSAITDTVYSAGVTGMEFWASSHDRLNGGKDFTSGRVELQIRDRFDLTDFAEVAYQSKEVIAHQFGEQTLKLHYALAAIAFRKPEAWNQKITVSASKLLADFGEDKKRNHYIPKKERGANKKSTCYLSKQDKLKKIAHHVYLIKRLEVWVREWRDRQKGIFTVEMSNLWDIYNIKQIVQKSLGGDNSIIDVEITYSPGSWFEKFAGHEYLKEFGYLSSESLKLDPYRDKIALRIAYFALFALQQNRNGHFKIESLLKCIGCGREIETASNDGSAASNLKRSFDRGLKTLAKFEHPYRFIYDVDVPEWVESESKIKKPKYWFNNWLKCCGTLYQPEIQPEPKPNLPISDFQVDKEQSSTQETISNIDLLAFGEQIRKARKANKKSLRTMAKQIDISPSRLSQIENGRYPHPVTPELKTILLTHLGLEA